MSHKSLIGAIGSATLALFSAVVFAQQQTDPSQDRSRAGPMGHGVMMGQMMTQHQEMSQLGTLPGNDASIDSIAIAQSIR